METVWKHLSRVVGAYANVFIFEVDNVEQLHAATTMPGVREVQKAGFYYAVATVPFGIFAATVGKAKTVALPPCNRSPSPRSA